MNDAIYILCCFQKYFIMYSLCLKLLCVSLHVQRLFGGDKLHIHVNSLFIGICVPYPGSKGDRCTYKRLVTDSSRQKLLINETCHWRIFT